MSQKGGSVWSAISALDAFPKVNEDFFKKTMSGGAFLSAFQHAVLGQRCWLML